MANVCCIFIIVMILFSNAWELKAQLPQLNSSIIRPGPTRDVRDPIPTTPPMDSDGGFKCKFTATDINFTIDQDKLPNLLIYSGDLCICKQSHPGTEVESVILNVQNCNDQCFQTMPFISCNCSRQVLTQKQSSCICYNPNMPNRGTVPQTHGCEITVTGYAADYLRPGRNGCWRQGLLQTDNSIVFPVCSCNFKFGCGFPPRLSFEKSVSGCTGNVMPSIMCQEDEYAIVGHGFPLTSTSCDSDSYFFPRITYTSDEGPVIMEFVNDMRYTPTRVGKFVVTANTDNGMGRATAECSFNVIVSPGYCGRTLCVNGECSDDGFTCYCYKGWSGPRCDVDIGDCISVPCQNNGSCFDVGDGYVCSCPEGFVGTVCETALDKCAMLGNICINGTCSFDTAKGFACDCFQGWTGTGCDRRTIETNSSGESSAQLSNVTTGLTGAGVVIIISLAVITIICLRYRHTASSGRSNSSTENKGAFTNTIYGDGERDSDIVVPIQSHDQIQSSKSEKYQGLSNRPKQDPYQDLKKIKARPNSYDDNNYIDPNEVNGRGSRRPTAPADDEAEYIDVDSEIQRAKPSYGTSDSNKRNGTSNVDPDYFQLEKPSTNGDPVYFQLEKENIESAQAGDENLQDYDRLAAGAGANPPREGQKNTTGGDDTYQHLKSNVSPVADNDDYQHLKRDGF